MDQNDTRHDSNHTEATVADLASARQRAEWQAKDAKAKALKQQFKRAMGWQTTPKKKAKPGSKGPSRGGKGKK